RSDEAFSLHRKNGLYAGAANRLRIGAAEAAPNVAGRRGFRERIYPAWQRSRPIGSLGTPIEAAFSRCPLAKGNAPMTMSASPPRTQPEPGKSFWPAGHNPALLAPFLYFDASFMVWVIRGPLAPIISAELGLDPAQKGLMVAVPTRAGAVLRLVNGVLVDRIGQKTTGTLNQLIVIAGLLVGWWFGIDSFAGTIAIGVILGFAGASFAVALPLASRWYPAEHQGKAMGLAGMGN